MIDMSNITVLPSGNHRVRIEHRGEVAGGTVATLEEAVQLRDEIKRQIVDGELVPTSGSSCKDLGRRFLASRAGNRSVDDDERRWHKRIATARWARLPVDAVTRKHGAEWLKALERTRTDYDPEIHGQREKKFLSWQLRKHCLVLARRFFEWCITEELIGANPFAGLTVEKQDGDEEDGWQEEWYLDGDEQARFLALWDTLPGLSSKYRLEKWIVAFALATGIRLGELACLHLADVHLEGPKPHIVVRYGSWDAKAERYRSPKGRKGEKKTRRVDLWGLGLEAARQWLAVRAAYIAPVRAATAEERKRTPPNGVALLFPTENGRRRDAKKPPRSWPIVVEAFGAVPRIGAKPWWHLLRHTCATSMLCGWWGLEIAPHVVQKVLGHSDIRTTMRYAKVAESTMQEVAAEAQRAYETSKVVPFRRHAAVTTKSGTPRSLGKTGRVRQDSNLRPTAPEALPFATIAEEIAWRDGLVTAFRHALEGVALGAVEATAEEVEWLDAQLARALEDYAAAVARQEVSR